MPAASGRDYKGPVKAIWGPLGLLGPTWLFLLIAVLFVCALTVYYLESVYIRAPDFGKLPSGFVRGPMPRGSFEEASLEHWIWGRRLSVWKLDRLNGPL